MGKNNEKKRKRILYNLVCPFFSFKFLDRGKSYTTLGKATHQIRIYPLQNCLFIPNFAP
jgi:hypothetical protein